MYIPFASSPTHLVQRANDNPSNNSWKVACIILVAIAGPLLLFCIFGFIWDRIRARRRRKEAWKRMDEAEREAEQGTCPPSEPVHPTTPATAYLEQRHPVAAFTITTQHPALPQAHRITQAHNPYQHQLQPLLHPTSAAKMYIPFSTSPAHLIRPAHDRRRAVWDWDNWDDEKRAIAIIVIVAPVIVLSVLIAIMVCICFGCKRCKQRRAVRKRQEERDVEGQAGS
ncbi:hypothetical protein ACJZ2D_015191 [Fusarium nematophilum]